MGDKELEEYLSLADLATSSPPPSSCIDGHTDTDSSSLKMKHIKESDLHQSDLEGTDDKAKEAANIMEVEIDEHGWQKVIFHTCFLPAQNLLTFNHYISFIQLRHHLL